MNNRLNEASISRLYTHLENHEPMVFISASKKENTEEQNNVRYKELKNFVKYSEYSYNRIIGGYKEKGGDVIEKSLIIFGDKDNPQELFEFARKLAVNFDQDSFLFTDTDGKVAYYDQDGDKLFDLSNKFSFHDIEEFFTKIGKKKFVFKSISEERKVNVTWQTKQIKHNYQRRLDESASEKVDLAIVVGSFKPVHKGH